MKFNIFLSLTLILGMLWGCNGPRVVNNVYDAPGGAPYVLASDMIYLGSPQISGSTGCVGIGCPSFGSPKDKVTVDFFVHEVDGLVTEYAAIIRKTAPPGYYWTSVSSPKVQFGGRDYGETFDQYMLSDDQVLQPLVSEKGYQMGGNKIFSRTLRRNVNRTTQIIVQYGRFEKYIPSSVWGDYAMQNEYLRKQFSEKIMVPGT